jgi:hypothetical protein
MRYPKDNKVVPIVRAQQCFRQKKWNPVIGSHGILWAYDNLMATIMPDGSVIQAMYNGDNQVTGLFSMSPKEVQEWLGM